MKSSRRGDFHHTVAVASESPCCLFAPVLELNLDTEAVELSSLFFSEARRGCQIYTGVPLHCFSSFPALNGRRMPALSESRLAPSCWGRFALLCQDPAGQGASFCGGWAHSPVPRGSSWDVAALHLSAMALGMWKQGWGEVYLFASLPLGDRCFEVPMGTDYNFRWSLRLDAAALKCLMATQPASASSEDLVLVLPVKPSWHKRPFYFGPAAIYAKSWSCWSQ